ncbi:hypothetical protein KY285_007530 [Solanum tuberosum]|nr:hypothetical protein KY285_007530 [Solanum tuberosum]
MTRTRSMASIKDVPASLSSSIEIDFISSDSSEAESFDPSPSTKKCPSAAKKKESKKASPAFLETFSDDDSLKFWGPKHKIMFVAFSERPIVPGRVINLEQLEASHSAISSFFRAQKLSLLLRLCGLEFFEEPVHLFCASLRISADSGEWETVVLGNRIVLNDSLFKDVFGFEFSGVIPFMHGNLWPDNFEISLEDAKLLVSDTGADLTNFGSRSLGFENRILAHIVATTLIPRKGSQSNISNRDHGICSDVQQRADAPKATRISADSASKEADLIKVRLDGLETHMQVLQDTLGKVLQLHKDSNIDVGKLRLEVEGLKKEAICSVNTILKEVNSIKTGADLAHNELDVTVHTSYSNFFKIDERFYDNFCRNEINAVPQTQTNLVNQGEITAQEIWEYATSPQKVDLLWILNQSDIHPQEIKKENQTIKGSRINHSRWQNKSTPIKSLITENQSQDEEENRTNKGRKFIHSRRQRK